MRTYQKHRFVSGSIVLSNDVNESYSEVLGTLNGRIDGNQIPLNVVVPPIMASSSVEYPTLTTTSSNGVSSNFHHGMSDVLAVIPGWATGSNVLRGGWNLISEQMDSGAKINFTSKEGMLTGGATVDIERRVGSTTAGGFKQKYDQEWTMEVGVFINNELVARTGDITIRRYTVDIPFCVPCGTEPIEIDTRFSVNHTSGSDAGTKVSGNGLWPNTPVQVHSSEIWVRNQKR